MVLGILDHLSNFVGIVMAIDSNFFDISRGIQIDSTVSIIYTPTASPDTADCGTASIGSLCMSKETGSIWKKVTDQGGVGDWEELANNEYALKVEHVFSTGLILDQVDTTLADQFAWMITAFDEITTSNRWSALITVSHNGTNLNAPTSIKYSLSNILKFGTSIKDLSVKGVLTLGDDGKTYMSLHVGAGVPTTFTSYRLVKNLASSRTVVLGGANLDNHIADGSVHLIPYQNALLDKIPQTSTGIVTVEMATDITTAIVSEVSSRQQADAGLQSSLDTEIAARIAGDIAVQEALTNEAIARQDALTTLSRTIAYDIASAVINKPIGNAKVLRFTAVRLFTLPTNLVGSWFVAGTPSSTTATFTVLKNSTNIGTITFNAGASNAVMSVTSSFFQLGDVLGINAPIVQDAKLADISFTIAASI